MKPNTQAAGNMIPSTVKANKLVHICDRDAKCCEDLSVLFRLEGYETSFSMTAAQFEIAIERRPPDVAVINLEMNEASGINLLMHVKALSRGAVVIMLADGATLDGPVQAMKHGATDVLSKPIDHELLLRVASDALARDVQIGAENGGQRSVTLRGFKQLTQREREVLQLIVEGHSNKEAGRELGISPRTIEVHRARVMDKFGAKNAADLMRIVLTR
jgi:two-component system response regulator FixJ